MAKIYLNENDVRRAIGRMRLLREGNIPEDVRDDFMNWVLYEADTQRRLGGPVNAVGLIYEYYTEDNDEALNKVIEAYKEERDIQVVPDSNEDIWLTNEIRKAVNEFGAMNINNDIEDGDMQEVTEPGNQQQGNIQQDFARWAMSEADNERMIGGPVNALGLMYDYYANNDEQALQDLVAKYKQSRGIEDSSNDAQLESEIVKAINAWGYYNAQSMEEPEDEYTLEEMNMLKETIKSMIRESFINRGMFQQPVSVPVDMQEKGSTKKSKWNPSNMHFKTNPKTARQRRQTKRAVVIKWLRDPSVNCAEIMRLLWHPAPEDEDTKRGEFYKKRDGAINKDSGARYSFSDEEINSLYKIKSGRS